MRLPPYSRAFVIPMTNRVTEAIRWAFLVILRRNTGLGADDIHRVASLSPVSLPEYAGHVAPNHLGLARDIDGEMMLAVGAGRDYMTPSTALRALIELPKYLVPYLTHFLSEHGDHLNSDEQSRVENAIALLESNTYIGAPNALASTLLWGDNHGLPVKDRTRLMTIQPMGLGGAVTNFDMTRTIMPSEMDYADGLMSDTRYLLDQLAQAVAKPVLLVPQLDGLITPAEVEPFLNIAEQAGMYTALMVNGVLPTREQPLTIGHDNLPDSMERSPRRMVDPRWFSASDASSLRDRYLSATRELGRDWYRFLPAPYEHGMPYAGALFNDFAILHTQPQLTRETNEHRGSTVFALIDQVNEAEAVEQVGVGFADMHKAMLDWHDTYRRVVERGAILAWAKRLNTRDLDRRRREVEDLQAEVDSHRTRFISTVRSRDAALLELRALESAQTEDHVPKVEALFNMIEAGTLKGVRVDPSLGVLIVNTPMVYIKDDRSGAWHEIGEFNVTIDINAGSVHFENLTHTTNNTTWTRMQHPHIFENGRACYGGAMDEAVANCIADRDWLTLIEMILAFLDQANTRDSAGRHVHTWPFVADPESVGLPPYEGEVQPYQERRFDGRGFDVDTGLHRETDDYYDPHGYNRDGYDRDGYDRRGFNRNGIHRITGTQYGPDGYNRMGFDERGYDEEGYDASGFCAAGYDRSGHDRDGYYNEDFDVDNGFDAWEWMDEHEGEEVIA